MGLKQLGCCFQREKPKGKKISFALQNLNTIRILFFKWRKGGK
jgi:hypothetical protein